VLDLAELVIPHFVAAQQPDGHDTTTTTDPSNNTLRTALDRYEAKAVARTRPAVLASRQACLDAHRWSRITDASPLLTRRRMDLEFDEADMDMD
jgi:hypothetical protein